MCESVGAVRGNRTGHNPLARQRLLTANQYATANQNRGQQQQQAAWHGTKKMRERLKRLGGGGGRVLRTNNGGSGAMEGAGTYKSETAAIESAGAQLDSQAQCVTDALDQVLCCTHYTQHAAVLQ